MRALTPPESAASDLREFDLSEFRAADWRWKNIHAYIRGAVAGASGVTGLLVAVSLASSLTGARERVSTETMLTEAAVLLIIGFIGYMTGVSVPSFLPGARRVSLDATGVHLGYSYSRTEDLLWDDPNLRITLFDYTQSSQVPPECAHVIERSRGLPVLGPYHRRSILSRPAFDATLALARAKGLRVSSYQASEWVEAGSPRIYRITAVG